MDQVRKIDLRIYQRLAVEWKDASLAGNFKLEHQMSRKQKRNTRAWISNFQSHGGVGE